MSKLFDVTTVTTSLPHMTGSKIIEVAKNYLPLVAKNEMPHLDIEVNLYYESKGTPQRHIFRYENQVGSIVTFAKKVSARIEKLAPLFGGTVGLSLSIEGEEQSEAITHQVLLHTNKHRISSVCRAMCVLNYAAYELTDENVALNDSEELL
jgi:hypothetical protein